MGKLGRLGDSGGGGGGAWTLRPYLWSVMEGASFPSARPRSGGTGGGELGLDRGDMGRVRGLGRRVFGEGGALRGGGGGGGGGGGRMVVLWCSRSGLSKSAS